MKSARSIALGVASSVLMAGTAFAADPPPVNMAMATPPAPGATGPEVTLDVYAMAGFTLPNQGFGTDLNGYLEVEWPSGWGIELDFGAGALLVGTGGFGGDLDVRVYRSFGDFEVGFGGGISGGCGFGPLSCGGGFGLPFVDLIYEHESGRFRILSENTYYFQSQDFDSYNEIEFQVSDRLLLYTEAFFDSFTSWWVDLGVEFDVSDRFSVEAVLFLNDSGYQGLHFGTEFALTPAVTLWSELDFESGGFDRVGFGIDYEPSEALLVWAELWADGGGVDSIGGGFDYEVHEGFDLFGGLRYDGDWSGHIGADFEKPIGTGNFSLIASSVLNYQQCCGGFSFGASVGVRYTIGDVEDDERPRFIGIVP